MSKNDYNWLKNVKRLIAWYKANGNLPTRPENQTLYRFWKREETYIDTEHFYAKFISFSKDAKESVKELQQIISKVSKLETQYHHRLPKVQSSKASKARGLNISKRA